MSNIDSRVSLDKTDNPQLQAYLKNKQPGDEYSLLIKGKVVDNTEEDFVGDVASVVEQDEADSEPDAGDASEGAEDEAPEEMGAVVAKAMGKPKAEKK